MSARTDTFKFYNLDDTPCTFSAIDYANLANATKCAADMLAAAADRLNLNEVATADSLAAAARKVYINARDRDVFNFPSWDIVSTYSCGPTVTAIEYTINNLELINEKCAAIVDAALALRNF